ncbi:hypothetical protein [Sphingomonas sp. MS122]|uniref:hypothetical protein n=1 Tax=Sphingomonas sp. MS122 TaxID=3412683 RepID=UPI003C2D704E
MAHSREPFDQPGEASVEAGLVLLDGPDGVAFAMTPDAAEATGRRLVIAAAQARDKAPAPPPRDDR